MSDIVDRLLAHGGNIRALRVEPQLMGEAAAEITRLRQSEAEVMVRILANTPPAEWLSNKEIHEALKAWRVE